jgi:chorismate lyase/3-hydroxybenzoate synthase
LSCSAPFNQSFASAENLEKRLSITLSDNVPGDQSGKSLLLGFHFGQSIPETSRPAMISAGIDPVDTRDLYECWWYDGPVHHTISDRMKITQCSDYVVVAVQVPETSNNEFRAATSEIYKELLQSLVAVGRPRLVRMWNFLCGINEGQGDAEKYRQFSIGRAEAFEKFGLHDQFVPAATAVGSPRSRKFTVIALATRHKFDSVENPRQVSAFNYPRAYGPRSPKFSRGGCVLAGEQRIELYSGTAAIVGHSSLHPGNTALQLEETLVNLGEVRDAMEKVNRGADRVALDRSAVLRVYLREGKDREIAASKIEKFLGGSSESIAYLRADICRRELNVEIDASKVVNPTRNGE